MNSMQVIKRDGRAENVSFDKIIIRIKGIKDYLNLNRVNEIEIAQETIKGLRDKITTVALDIYAADKCAERIIDDPQYSMLASGICVSNLHKTTDSDFMKVTGQLYFNYDGNGRHMPLVTKSYYDNVEANIEIINKTLDYSRDYLYDFFAIKTLENTYLHKAFVDNVKKIVERPQHLFMREALGIHHNMIDKVVESYCYLSQKYFTHASPTMFNTGAPRPQLSSCFLLHMEDNIEGIFKTITDVAKISKYAGGIGIHLQDMRALGSLIRGTNGNSKGIIPIIKILNETGKCINQGGKRNGAIAVYIEPWHSDIFDFCELKRNTGIEEMRARDIFLGLWIPDLFMERVRDNKKWSLMCPDKCPGLTDAVGDDFKKLYEQYEADQKYNKQVNATDLWKHILESLIETGIPYIHFKDTANKLSNQQNIGTIKSSNLCGEIIQYSDANEIAVCNLASICLPSFIKDGRFDFELLSKISGIITENLNKIIDVNYYPVPEAKTSNMRHRPIGIGVQGLADVFCILDIPYESENARILNKSIFEAIYYGALRSSCDLAKEFGHYESFIGSPFSQGKLQFHLWGLSENSLILNQDWKTLISDIKQYGTRNSLLTTVMPTATTSQIMGFNECTEPFTTNLYTRTTLAGEYTLVNKYLIEKLINLGLWTREIKEELLLDNGSVKDIYAIPQHIRDIFKTAFEMQMKPYITLAADRGPFIDQSQSMNLFIKEPNNSRLHTCLFYAWEQKLKTGVYYLRSQPAVNAIKFGLEIDSSNRIINKRKTDAIATGDTETVCFGCH
jgi:ribonucleoside-diphosphate reductase alpha chain